MAKPAFGHNKDHRPYLRQLLFVLTVSDEGAVPITYRTEDGNTSDDVTHVPTWDGLCSLVGRADSLYVADSKLCSKEAMGHTSLPVAAASSRSCRTAAERTPGSASGHRPMRRGGWRLTAVRAHVSAILTRSGRPSRRRFLPPTVTG